MRLVVLAVSTALAGLAQPVLAAERAPPKPIVCGVRDETQEEPPASKAARAVAESFVEPANIVPDEKDASGFQPPNKKLYLVSLDDKTQCSQTSDGRCKWGLVKPLTYQPSNTQDTVTAPKGMPTDLASIPSFVWPLLPPDGPWLKGAVIHDFLYRTCGRGTWLNQPWGFTRKTCQPGKDCYTREEADWILRDAMKDRGVGVFKRNVIWLAVRWFGAGGWGH